VEEFSVLVVSRRLFINLAVSGLASATAGPVWVSARGTGDANTDIDPGLLRRALEALEQHQDRIDFRDVIGVADFSKPSRTPRFHVVSLTEGNVRSYLVAHGRGSDPSHTGWLERFSNEPHSNATSDGAYRTGAMYMGAHGHSMRLEGLDPTNSNTLSRAIVVHSAWYVNERVIGAYGVLGRSQGCFAVADASLPEITDRLGPGRLIFAGKA
jgi:L,D-transpeptidase catalytic domain